MTPDHVLKSWPAFFQAIKSGAKKHDVRDMSDRTFKIGDVCLLREYEPFEGRYTGESLLVRVTFITSRDTPCAFSSGGLDRNLAILSFELEEDYTGEVDPAKAAAVVSEFMSSSPILSELPWAPATDFTYRPLAKLPEPVVHTVKITGHTTEELDRRIRKSIEAKTVVLEATERGQVSIERTEGGLLVSGPIKMVEPTHYRAPIAEVENAERDYTTNTSWDIRVRQTDFFAGYQIAFNRYAQLCDSLEAAAKDYAERLAEAEEMSRTFETRARHAHEALGRAQRLAGRYEQDFRAAEKRILELERAGGQSAEIIRMRDARIVELEEQVEKLGADVQLLTQEPIAIDTAAEPLRDRTFPPGEGSLVYKSWPGGRTTVDTWRG